MEPYPGQKPNSTVYHHDGYDYHRDNLKNITNVNYKCAKTSCRARARHTLTEPNNIEVTLHNHAKDSTKFRTHAMRETLRRRSKEDLNSNLADIFRQVSAQFVDVAELVSPLKEKKAMRKVRKDVVPDIPNTFAELADVLSNDEQVRNLFGKSAPLPEEVIKEDYFMKKLEGPDGVSLVFASPSLVEKSLKTSSKIQLDGTFKVMPCKPKGRQLLSVHAIHGNNSFPVVFCLMESKKKQGYRRFLDYLKLELAPGWEPTDIMTDFEKSLRSAIKVVFPNATLAGCYFHYTQAVQKKWSQHGMLKVKARLKDEAKDLKEDIMSLAFARPEDIQDLFDEIDENLSIALHIKAQSFLEYFKRTWLSTNDQNFKPEDFSIYGHPDRTNNHLESFHSRLHLKKPNIWKFLNMLIDVTVESRQNFGRFMNGVPFTKPVPLRVLWTEQRVINARALFEANRIKAKQFIRWCRQVTRDTQAVVRQGRCLRRYLRAQHAELEYDEVATSSDESLNSSFDWEYEPNPHQQDRLEAEDEEADEEVGQLIEDGAIPDEEDFLIEDASESVPSDTDSVWNVEEDAMLLELSQHDLNNTLNVPVVAPPPQAGARVRPPNACVICLSDVAVWVAVPCHHALVCDDCKGVFFDEKCSRCFRQIYDFIKIIIA